MKKYVHEALDKTDVQILRLLQQDGRLSNAKLAEKVNLSETPCWRRLKRLEEEGYISGYRAQLDRRKLNYRVLAFVQVKISSHHTAVTEEFERAVAAQAQVLSCHNVSGEADYMLQVVAEDLEAFGLYSAEVLRRLPGVASVHSTLSLRSIKEGDSLPL
ncbi:Lrp/AsnC family transcriptional regulator [Balneatrix alpica]|uniref:Lrp/AsnC family transcriptional regulator n=1 Tax=Balneatrix alpica TaxID=75684 RepID=A0ABV5ZEQ2_9GAMM|nr:Lrp/AsnC family transcriptional regulator [Balneatrix alpica]